MKIRKYGVVILTAGPVKVEDWIIEREPEDPKDATDEQLLLGFAIHWAKAQLETAIKSSTLDVFRKAAQEKLKDQRDWEPI